MNLSELSRDREFVCAIAIFFMILIGWIWWQCRETKPDVEEHLIGGIGRSISNALESSADKIGGKIGVDLLPDRPKASEAVVRNSPIEIPPEQVLDIGSWRYLLVRKPMTFNDAQAVAEFIGGNLAMINNADHNRQLSNFIRGKGTEFWLGYRAVSGPTDWRAVNGATVVNRNNPNGKYYGNFASGEPNNRSGSGGPEGYAVITARGGVPPNGFTWRDVPGDRKYPFLIKYEPGKGMRPSGKLLIDLRPSTVAAERAAAEVANTAGSIGRGVSTTPTRSTVGVVEPPIIDEFSVTLPMVVYPKGTERRFVWPSEAMFPKHGGSKLTVTFEVRTKEDIQLALADRPVEYGNKTTPLFEIIINGWRDLNPDQSAIRNRQRQERGAGRSQTTVRGDFPPGGNATGEYIPYWITYDQESNRLDIGYGRSVGQNRFITRTEKMVITRLGLGNNGTDEIVFRNVVLSREPMMSIKPMPHPEPKPMPRPEPPIRPSQPMFTATGEFSGMKTLFSHCRSAVIDHCENNPKCEIETCYSSISRMMNSRKHQEERDQIREALLGSELDDASRLSERLIRLLNRMTGPSREQLADAIREVTDLTDPAQRMKLRQMLEKI